MKRFPLLALPAALLFAALTPNVQAVPVTVTAAGLALSDSSTFLTDGFGILNGGTSGVNWTYSGEREGMNSDWQFMAGLDQGRVAGTQMEWNAPGQFQEIGFTIEVAIMGIGGSMAANVLAEGQTLLRIAEVAPAAGAYTLNGVTQTATAVGQILLWTAPVSELVQGNTLNYSSNAVLPDSRVLNSGPIGFSAVPEPASAVLGIMGGVAALGMLRRRQRV